MAKKSSNNAVKKLDKQIKDLENSIKEDKSETLPVLDKKKIEEAISNGSAYRKFIELVENQGGDISYINNIDKFEKSKYIIPVTSLKSGIISDINAEDISNLQSSTFFSNSLSNSL